MIVSQRINASLNPTNLTLTGETITSRSERHGL